MNSFLKKTPHILAISGACAAVVMLGASTSANWSDADVLDSATITSGTLDVAGVGEPVWSNESTPGADPTAVLPGESLLGLQAGDLALEGDNLATTIRTSYVAPGGSTEATTPPDGYTVTYRVLDGKQEPLTEYVPINTTAPNVTFTPAQAAATLDGDPDFYIEVRVEAPESVGPDPVLEETYQGNYSTTIEQVR